MGKITSPRIWKCYNILPKIVFMHINVPKPGFTGRLLRVSGKFHVFSKKVIPSSFRGHEVLLLGTELEQSLVAFDYDFSHQSSPEGAEPFHPNIPEPAAQVSLNTSWLYQLLLHFQLGFTANVECLVCPQACPSSLPLCSVNNGSTSPVLPWLFFRLFFFQPGSAEPLMVNVGCCSWSSLWDSHSLVFQVTFHVRVRVRLTSPEAGMIVG